MSARSSYRFSINNRSSISVLSFYFSVDDESNSIDFSVHEQFSFTLFFPPVWLWLTTANRIFICVLSEYTKNEMKKQLYRKDMNSETLYWIFLAVAFYIYWIFLSWTSDSFFLCRNWCARAVTMKLLCEAFCWGNETERDFWIFSHSLEFYIAPILCIYASRRMSRE